MIDLYIRAANAGALASACPFLRAETEDGDGVWLTTGDGWALDVIGKLLITPAEVDEDGHVTAAPVYATGFHVNLRCTEAIAAEVPEHMIITPTTPRRVWA